MDFHTIEGYAETISNGILGNLNTKLIAKENIMNLIGLSCLNYSHNEKFKKEMDAYLALKGFL
jgi:hypothetical protein